MHWFRFVLAVLFASLCPCFRFRFRFLCSLGSAFGIIEFGVVVVVFAGGGVLSIVGGVMACVSVAGHSLLVAVVVGCCRL